MEKNSHKNMIYRGVEAGKTDMVKEAEKKKNNFFM